MSDRILTIGNIIGYVLQSIYLAYFIICVKGLKNKRILFFILVFLEYFFFKCIHELDYSVNFELLLGISIYMLLMLVYRDKVRITDIITYIISLLVLGVVSVPIALLIGMNIYGLIISTILPILITFLLRHKLIKIDEFYNKFWNRHSNNKMLKSITIRGFSSALTIYTFLLLHLWLIYGILVVRR